MSNPIPPVVEEAEQQHTDTVKTKTVSTSKIRSKEGSSRKTQEKAMLGLLGVFVGGVIALTIVPAPFTGIVMGLITFLTLLAIFRF